MSGLATCRNQRAGRAAVIRTRQVAIKTTLLLFRCRNVIEQGKGGQQIVAEEMLLWGWRGTPHQKEFLTHAQANALLAEARASSDLSPQARASFLENELKLLRDLETAFDAVAEQRQPPHWRISEGTGARRRTCDRDPENPPRHARQRLTTTGIRDR